MPRTGAPVPGHPQLMLFWGAVRDHGCCKPCTPALLLTGGSCPTPVHPNLIPQAGASRSWCHPEQQGPLLSPPLGDKSTRASPWRAAATSIRHFSKPLPPTGAEAESRQPRPSLNSYPETVESLAAEGLGGFPALLGPWKADGCWREGSDGSGVMGQGASVGAPMPVAQPRWPQGSVLP